MILSPGEKIHVIERRLFEGDLRRHFVGEVESSQETQVRVRGYAFVYVTGRREFMRRGEERSRLVTVDNLVILNVLPANANIGDVQYVQSGTGLKVTDGQTFQLDINEFVPPVASS